MREIIKISIYPWQKQVNSFFLDFVLPIHAHSEDHEDCLL